MPWDISIGLTVSARRLPDPVPGICYETHPIASG